MIITLIAAMQTVILILKELVTYNEEGPSKEGYQPFCQKEEEEEQATTNQ